MKEYLRRYIGYLRQEPVAALFVTVAVAWFLWDALTSGGPSCSYHGDGVWCAGR